MGLLDVLFRLLGSEKSSSSGAGSKPVEPGSGVDMQNIEYNGSRFYCEYSEASNGEWKAAYGKSLDGEDQVHRLFLFRDGGLQFTERLERIEDAAVSSNGRVLAIDGESRDDLSGRLYVFDRSGSQVFSHGFDANVGGSAISRDGEYAAAATLNPDCSTYIFDLDEEKQVARHENRDGNKMGLDFQEDGEGLRLYLAESPDSDPFYAVDLNGEVVWRSEELERQQRLQSLMDSSEEDDLEEALDLLEEAYDLAEEENEKKNVARKLADTHWNLAKEINREEDDSDEWWRHLNQAKAYYSEILPWYDGKQGVAKVSRKQGKYYLNQGEEEAALEMFQNIADLEKEYDVQLLTDADKRKIERLSQDP